MHLNRTKEKKNELSATNKTLMAEINQLKLQIAEMKPKNLTIHYQVGDKYEG
jgi:outer membrane murein-binding lipoprotein Lpp